jgi:hypothetical protein
MLDMAHHNIGPLAMAKVLDVERSAIGLHLQQLSYRGGQYLHLVAEPDWLVSDKLFEGMGPKIFYHSLINTDILRNPHVNLGHLVEVPE